MKQHINDQFCKECVFNTLSWLHDLLVWHGLLRWSHARFLCIWPGRVGASPYLAMTKRVRQTQVCGVYTY